MSGRKQWATAKWPTHRDIRPLLYPSRKEAPDERRSYPERTIRYKDIGVARNPNRRWERLYQAYQRNYPIANNIPLMDIVHGLTEPELKDLYTIVADYMFMRHWYVP